MEIKTKVITLLIAANIVVLFAGFQVSKSEANVKEKSEAGQKDKKQVKDAQITPPTYKKNEEEQKNTELENLKTRVEKTSDGRTVWKNDVVSRIDILVNSKVGLHQEYRPDDLVPVNVPFINLDGESNTLRKVAAEAVEEMFRDAENQRVYLVGVSGFRSFEKQTRNYNRDLNRYGQDYVDKYVATPGTSEHQLGLALDISLRSLNYDLVPSFTDTMEGKWLQNHSYEYGFIMRYPEDKQEIVGYAYEPWHYRYVGKDLAKEIYESGLTYEEFLQNK